MQHKLQCVALLSEREAVRERVDPADRIDQLGLTVRTILAQSSCGRNSPDNPSWHQAASQALSPLHR